MQSFSQIIKEALEVKSQGLVALVEEASRVLSKEQGKLGNMHILGRLVELKPSGDALVIGDLHGDLESLVDIMKESNFLQEMTQTSSAIVVFLGDYGDRGPFSAEVYYTVLKLKMAFPEQVVLMRGNHEGPQDLLAHPHDLPKQFEAKFGKEWQDAYTKIRALHQHLYNVVLVKQRYVMIHGGLPSNAKTVRDLAYAHNMHPERRTLEEMLWSDPEETAMGASPSPRGAGKLFGKDITDRILDRFGVRVLIRGHQPCQEGFRIGHEGKVLTLFSSKGPPYFNAYGAYLEIGLREKTENAEQLIPYIHKF